MKLWKDNERTGTRYWYRKLEFFACEGLILLFDHASGEHREILPTDFEERANALEAGIQRYLQATGNPGARESARDHTNAVKKMRAAIAEARYMGDPSSPAVQAFLLKHRHLLRGVQAGYEGVVGHQTVNVNPLDHKELPAPPAPMRHSVITPGVNGKPAAVAANVPEIYVPAKRRKQIVVTT